MKLKSFRASLFLCFSIFLFGSRVASAQQVQPLEPDWLRQMYEQGWQKVQEGVLQREAGEGQIETFSYGAEGLQWVIEGYERRLAVLEEEYRESPTEELAAVIEQLEIRLESVQGDLAAAPLAESIHGEALAVCNVSFDALEPSVGPQRSPRGVTATATAFFAVTGCSVEGHTYAEAWAHATEGGLETTVHRVQPKSSLAVDGNPPITSSASASANGSTDCQSWAWAEVRVPQYSIVYQTGTEPTYNYSCPPDITASITGPALVNTDASTANCADVTWTASATGGNPGYTYQWYIGSSPEGTGPTLTKQYCGVDTMVNVRVVATDTRQWTNEATFVTEVQHIDPFTVSINGLDRVDTNGATPCVDVTWSANATGGHPGYTYQWYTGTGTTVEGTGSTFIKRYCSTTQVVTARVVAHDADGHPAEATKQTSIVHTNPVVASISGPAQVVTDSYTSTCADVTWTASATGGAPGYTYKWYLGTSTTLQGTGTTLTKRYCNTNGTASVKVVATDSQGLTDDATFSTTLEHRDTIVPTISGPSSVTTNSTNSCANVTWTASATSTGGKHSGFTYRWYIGSSTAIQSSTSTLTQQYCSTSQSVTVKLVAQASDGHTSEVTKVTTITHQADPLSVTISGPNNTYIVAGCQNIIWTASATGGASSYSYTWYVGTTVVAYGPSYGKTYCQSATANVKVVVSDSAGATAEDTHTTRIYWEP